MSKFFKNKLCRYFSIFLFFNTSIPPVSSSSALAAWVLKSHGVLELRTKTNTTPAAYFQTAGNNYGDRFWIDFPGELKQPRIIKGNGPVREIRLGKPINGKTRLVIEFSERNNVNPLNWTLVGLDENRWRIKLFTPKNSFREIGEGLVNKKSVKVNSNKIPNYYKKRNFDYFQLPDIKQNKFLVVIDPGHGGSDPGAIGIGGIKEADVVLDVSKTVKKLLNEKGVKVP